MSLGCDQNKTGMDCKRATQATTEMDKGTEALEYLHNCQEDITTCRRTLIGAQANFKNSLLMMQTYEEQISEHCLEKLSVELEKMRAGVEALKGLSTELSSLYFQEAKTSKVLTRLPKGRNADSGIASEDSKVLFERQPSWQLLKPSGVVSEETVAKKLSKPPQDLSQSSTDTYNSDGPNALPPLTDQGLTIVFENTNEDPHLGTFTEQFQSSEKCLLTCQGQAVHRTLRRSHRVRAEINVDTESQI